MVADGDRLPDVLQVMCWTLDLPPLEGAYHWKGNKDYKWKIAKKAESDAIQQHDKAAIS